LAERVNGIIKDEYLIDYRVNNIIKTKKGLAFAVELYNNDKPYMSNGNLYINRLLQNNIIRKIMEELLQKNTNIKILLQILFFYKQTFLY